MDKSLIADIYDASYTEMLKENMNWLPFTGKQYPEIPVNNRLLILGESCYAWKNNAVEISADENHIRENVYGHMNDSGFFANIVKTLVSKDRITKNDRRRFWEMASFQNLVTTPMATVKHRPSLDDYKKGWEVYWQVHGILQPAVCIVLGTEAAKIDSFLSVLRRKRKLVDHKKELNLHFPKVGRYYAKTLSFDVNGKNIKFFFIKHPSSFFSWKVWNKFLKNNIPDVIGYYQKKIEL